MPVWRTSTAASVTAAALMILAPAAQAHAGPTLPDVVHYRCVVTGIDPPVPGIDVIVARSGESITVSNRTASTVTILGYAGEPYVRLSPTGAEENVNALSSFLNASLLIQSLPQDLGEAASRRPSWQRRGVTPSFTWHDHRLHWMSPDRPPVVKAAPGTPHLITLWAVTMQVDGRPVTVHGRLDWLGARSAWLNGWRLGLAMAFVVLGPAAMLVGGARWLSRRRGDQPASMAPSSGG